MKRYPVYKDSGIDWLGKIPEHWDIIRLKYLFKEVNIRSESGNEVLLSMTRNRGLIPQSEMTERPPSASTLVGYKLCNIGEIVMNKMQAWNGMFSAVKIPGIVSPDYTVFSPSKRLNIEYYTQLFKTPRMIDIFHCSSKGLGTGFFRLYTPDFGDIFTVYPPIDEQNAIMHFIDRKLEEIDHFIRNKQRLIELLNEQKTAIIKRAVTKGINPHVPMKHSGIEWLGEIPAHWESKRVKYITDILRGKFTHRPRNDPRMYDGKYPFIQTGDVASAKKYVTKYHQTLNKEGFAVSKQFPKGTLVMTIAANVGDIAILDFEACFPDSIVGFVPKEFMNLDYLYNLFLAMRQELFRIAPMNTQLNLNVERIGALWAVVPPIQEQVHIVQLIDKESMKIDEAIAKAEKEIQLIQEYRTTLISDAVTGRIDVRLNSVLKTTLTA